MARGSRPSGGAAGPVAYAPGMKYPTGALAFLALLAAAAAAILASAPWVFSLARVEWPPLLIWCALGAFSESSSVHIPRGNIQVSSTEAIFIASYFSFGYEATFLVIACATLLNATKMAGALKHVLNTHIRLTAFNAAHYVVILWAIDRLYLLLGGKEGEIVLLPAMIVAPLFFLSSCLLNSLFYKLEEGRSFFGYFRDTFAAHLPVASVLSLSGIIIALSYPRYGILSLSLFALPLFLSRLSFLSDTGEWE